VAEVPGTPTLLSVTASETKGGDYGVELVWSQSNYADYYSIHYGVESGKYIYGVANVGNTTTYRIGDLNKGQVYYFSVQAHNECHASNHSNQLRFPQDKIEAHELANTANGFSLAMWSTVFSGITTMGAAVLRMKSII